MTLNHHEIEQLTQVVTQRTIDFLSEEVAIPTIGRGLHAEDVQQLNLREFNALVSVGGTINLLIVFSFAMPLMDELFVKYTSDIDVPADKHETYREATAAEVINIIVGNCTTAMLGDESLITLSPPVVFKEAKSIYRSNGANFYAITLNTKYGCMDIDFIGPKDLFDDYLNYLEKKA